MVAIIIVFMGVWSCHDVDAGEEIIYERKQGDPVLLVKVVCVTQMLRDKVPLGGDVTPATICWRDDLAPEWAKEWVRLNKK